MGVRIELEDQEWNTVMAALSAGPWNQVNGVLLKIGGQLQAARVSNPGAPIAAPHGNAGVGTEH